MHRARTMRREQNWLCFRMAAVLAAEQTGNQVLQRTSLLADVSVYLPWIYWSGSNAQNPKTQGQGSDGYLSPKKTSESKEAALGLPDSG